jgi:AGCS family alanine or glycine:cation symporter
MTYIRRGLGKKWGWLSVLFCLGTLFSSLITGNAIQSNSVADSLSGLTNGFFGLGAGIESVTGVATGVGGEMVAGLLVAALVFIVIVGGIKSIGAAAEKIVPTMAIAYILMALIAVIMNFEYVPAAFGQIFASAFTGQAAAGGFLGAAAIVAIRAGVARGLFSNEAGQGSTPMAHAVAQTTDPARQGQFAMMGTFIDTLVVCTMTGLVILTVQGAFPHVTPAGVLTTQEHVWTSDLRGFAMTEAAFAAAFPFVLPGGLTLGGVVASVALILFVFTTLVTWSYYGERAATYLFGPKVAMPFRVLWVLMIFVGSFQQLELVWRMGDISNAAMALPNLVALVMLSGVVFALARGDKTAGRDHG